MFINYRLADGTMALVEVDEEVGAYLLSNDREIANADRRERYHAPWHIEAMEYEGDSLAYRLTPEEIVMRKETAREMGQALSTLTDAQLRRVFLKAEGRTLREIAALERTTVNAVVKSLELAKKKFEDFQKKI